MVVADGEIPGQSCKNSWTFCLPGRSRGTGTAWVELVVGLLVFGIAIGIVRMIVRMIVLVSVLR